MKWVCLTTHRQSSRRSKALLPHRTPNHDNFGLAVLIFICCLAAGIPSPGYRWPTALAIRLRTTFVITATPFVQASARQIAPPPNSIPMSLVPSAMREMFERAFTEVGSQGNRPSAKEWVDALDLLRRNLKQCSKRPNPPVQCSLAKLPMVFAGAAKHCVFHRAGGRWRITLR